jgi:hypothetical protein
MARQRWEPQQPAPGACDYRRCAGCQLAPNAATILRTLDALTATTLADTDENTTKLRAASLIWERMGGRGLDLEAQHGGRLARTWFRLEDRLPQDTRAVRPDDRPLPQPSIAADQPLPEAHELEPTLLWALIPFTAFRAASLLCPGDRIEDLFMDGLCALLLAIRRETQAQGDLERNVLSRVRAGVYRSEGQWRECQAAHEAFASFPASFGAAAHQLSPHIPRREAPVELAPRQPAPKEPLPHVLKLVDQATDLKLLRHRSEAALALLSEADALCEIHQELPPALRGLVAYRMGHLRMRQGASLADLLDAEQDFQRACRLGRGLEPWAGLYHLAVLGRLNAMRPDPSIQQRLAARWQKVLHQQAILDPTLQPDRDDPIVQRGSLNATEALGYALGLDLAGLEGLGSLQHTLNSELDWGHLVGPGLTGAHVRLPWATLTAVLLQIREQQPEALFFTLPAPEQTPLLWSPGNEHPTSIGRKQAGVLAWTIRGSPGGHAGLDTAIYGGTVAATTRRKLIQRTRELLATSTGQIGDGLLLREHDHSLRLAPELVVYGAVKGDRSHDH